MVIKLLSEKEQLIVQYNKSKHIKEDISGSVEFLSFDNNCYKIKYKGSVNYYYKKKTDITIYKAEKKYDVSNYVLKKSEETIYGAYEVVLFGCWAKVFCKNENTVFCEAKDLSFLKEVTKEKNVKLLLDYLKDVASIVDEEDDEDVSFLKNQLKSIKIFDNSALVKLLEKKNNLHHNSVINYYPFNINLAQKRAIDTALENDLSIIQGPPGTGKTETILNIVSNLIIQGKTVAVLSGNNEAIKNVKDKFEKSGFSSINAYLGKNANVEEFFNSIKKPTYYKTQDLSENGDADINECQKQIDYYHKLTVTVAYTVDRLNEYRAEERNFIGNYNENSFKSLKEITRRRLSAKQVLELIRQFEYYAQKRRINYFQRAKHFFKYGVKVNKEIIEKADEFRISLQREYYRKKIVELNEKKKRDEDFCKSINIEHYKRLQKEISINELKKAINKRLKKARESFFTEQDYKKKFVDFVKSYPVIYSTTHSIRKTIPEDYLFDYVIIDESSQVDLASAVIALSAAKCAVLVGDEKQLPPVIQSDKKSDLKKLFNVYRLDECFDYVNNSIISCVQKVIPDIKKTFLNEHFRCDPQIIDFCNKRFYDNQLIIRTEHQDGCGVTIISHGSHFERNRSNEREVDIIEQEIIKDYVPNQIGIIAPYNKQIDLINARLGEKGYEASTIHKFQGKERDYIVLSTVTNKIKFYEDEEKEDFLNNPNLINVAISRAKKRLFVLASEMLLNTEGSLLNDMQKYYNYYCSGTVVKQTSVYSVFDLMYDDYAAVLESFKKKLVNISQFDSENIIATVIEEICNSQECGAIGYKFNYPLRYIIKAESLTDPEDIKFVRNWNTHCDFVLYSEMDKSIRLIIEVDGSQHAEETQMQRDIRKDRLLQAAGLKIIRLSTTSTNCKEKIVASLK